MIPLTIGEELAGRRLRKETTGGLVQFAPGQLHIDFYDAPAGTESFDLGALVSLVDEARKVAVIRLARVAPGEVFEPHGHLIFKAGHWVALEIVRCSYYGPPVTYPVPWLFPIRGELYLRLQEAGNGQG